MKTKILVMSDSHGAMPYIKKIMEKEADHDMIFFLGDGVIDMRLCTMNVYKPVVLIKGNNDMRSSEELPEELILDVDGYRIMLCHGHRHGVKGSSAVYEQLARTRGCHVAMYGHTHRAFYECHDGLHVFNPGSVFSSRSYGIVETSENGISFDIKNL